MAFDRLEIFAVFNAVELNESLPVFRRWLAFRDRTTGKRRIGIDVVFAIVGMIDAKRVFAFDVGTFSVEDF